MKNSVFIIITALILFSSCKSKGGAVTDASCESCEDVIIRFYGEPASNGCGWVLKASETIYMPKNLLPEFL